MDALTIEEENLISMYSVTDRQVAIEGLSEALPYLTEDIEMLKLACSTINKLVNMEDYEFAELKLIPTEG